MKKTDKERYQELQDSLQRWNQAYYNDDAPLVDDAVYDEAMKELQELERRYPEIASGSSPSARVGGEVSSGFDEVAHRPPMLSLANATEEGEVRNFAQRCYDESGAETFYAELKFDGLAVEVEYRQGRFFRGSTRGDGRVGEDITANVATIESLPKHIDNAPSLLQLRGEVYLSHDEFERINAEREEANEKPFANPRNAAAGSLRQLDASVTASRRLQCVLYGNGQIDDIEIGSQLELYEFMRRYGLPVSSHQVSGSVDDVVSFYHHWLAHRHELPYDIDGIVIKINEYTRRDEMGETSKAPRWALAWKFPAREAITRLIDVQVQVGRTGVVTPVAHLSPINIGGVVVKRASLHNFDEIDRLGIATGDSVRVIRAGDVIPKVQGVFEEGSSRTPVTVPESCPSCGEALQREDVYYRCVNPACPAIVRETLAFFVSKDGMDIEFFGPELVRRLYDAGKLRDIPDIYRLDLDTLVSMERMGEKAGERILASIDERRRVPLHRLLRSLGIRNVGDHIARVLARYAGTLDGLRAMSEEELRAIHEIGPGVASSLYGFLHSERGIGILDGLFNAGFSIEEEDTSNIQDTLTGKTVVFTGTLEKLSRTEAKELVESLGGRASSSVSSKTDFCVAGPGSGSKEEKARSLGVPVLTEDEFMKLIGRDNE